MLKTAKVQQMRLVYGFQHRPEFLAQLLPRSIEPHLHRFRRTIQHCSDFRVGLLFVFCQHERDTQIFGQAGDSFPHGGGAFGNFKRFTRRWFTRG